MAVFKPPTEAEISEAFTGDVAEGIPELRGKKPVRRLTANVVEILRSNNNFFITGDRGLAAVGVTDPLVLSRYLAPDEGESFEAEEVVKDHNHTISQDAVDKALLDNCPACQGWKENPSFDPSAALAMVPGIVEVILLLSCEKATLRMYLTRAGRETLADDVFELMEKCDPMEVLKCMDALGTEFKHLQNSSTKPVEKAPHDAEMGEG